MTVHRERLESLLERLQRLRHSRPTAPEESQPALPKDVASVHLPSTPEPVPSRSEVSTLLELLALRDRYIQSELLKLQRTLSRQTFRGAESARRLVRRLARRAEQNVADVKSLRDFDDR
jgi:hypothetical protein